MTKEFSNIESEYITDRFNLTNHFFIDSKNILWGTGSNEYWQLGIPTEEDRNNLGMVYSTPIKIAENVIHVDSSENGYFIIYLTEDHKLYGLGANTNGILRQPIIEFEELNYHQNITAKSTLLMDKVLFASAGRESICVLTENNSVWWWGKFASSTATNQIDSMYIEKPCLMVENAKYTVCGSDMAAAIDQDDNLWTWGNNVWGQCGISYGKDYINEAKKVCSEVNMVWLDTLNSKQNMIPPDELPDTNPYEDITYSYTTFIRKNDGQMYACGINLGMQLKTVKIHGDISAEDQEHKDKSRYTFNYSPEFEDVEIKCTEEVYPQ